MILEVLKILESEVNLREQTRVAEQAKAGVEQQTHHAQAQRLSEVQESLGQRVAAVIARIEELPDAGQQFSYEINLLTKVTEVMEEAADILAGDETGSRAIATETEAIELLLQSKRINPKGGGGGGASPGGGGSGDTQDSALALLGRGVNEKEQREHRNVKQSTGENGRTLPEEFRAGLDEYFQRWESGS